MIIRREYGDIFDLKYAKIHKAHCVSADLALGAGIAKKMDDAYHIKDQIKTGMEQLERDGESFHVPFPGVVRTGNIYNVVTKQKYFHKPTNKDFTSAFVHLRNMMLSEKVYSVVMPEVGSGLDRLDKSWVFSTLSSIFLGSPISVTMVVYSKDLSGTVL